MMGEILEDSDVEVNTNFYVVFVFIFINLSYGRIFFFNHFFVSFLGHFNKWAVIIEITQIGPFV